MRKNEREFHRPNLPPEKIPAVMNAKWGLPILKEGYVPMPKMLLRASSQLFPHETALLDLIVILAVSDCITARRDPISFEYVAFIAGLPVDEVKESIARSVGQKLLTFEAVEKHRYKPQFTGLYEQVTAINQKYEPDHLDEGGLVHEDDFPTEE